MWLFCLFICKTRITKWRFSLFTMTDVIFNKEEDVISPVHDAFDGPLCFYDVLADYFVRVPESGKPVLDMIVQLWSQSFASHIFSLLFHKWVCKLVYALLFFAFLREILFSVIVWPFIAGFEFGHSHLKKIWVTLDDMVTFWQIWTSSIWRYDILEACSVSLNLVMVIWSSSQLPFSLSCLPNAWNWF